MPPASEVVDAILRALDELGTCRQNGFGIGRIPIDKAWAYFEHAGYDAAAVDLWARLVLIADKAFVVLGAKKASE